MNIQRASPFNESLAKLIFLILPTALVGYFLLIDANDFYNVLQNDAWRQTICFSGAMIASAIFYSFRFRFLLPFLALVAFLFLTYKGLDSSTSEFYVLIAWQMKILGFLIVLGWLFGWALLRLRYASIFMAAFMLLCSIALIAKIHSDTVPHLQRAFVPIVIYAVYIIFIAEQIYSYKDKSKFFWWFLAKRLAGFTALAALLMLFTWKLNQKEIEDTVANFGGGGKTGDASMLKKDEKGNFDLKNYSKLRSSLSRNNELLFCAHIDNFFEGTDVPNPLYLTAFYYTKFDTLTETFERDTLIPKNDLFEPDPSALSLFQTQIDTNVIKNSGTEFFGKVVDIEVYSRKLSASTYLAPHTGFFVQPITIEKEFRDSFQSAFRAKSYVSKLNSAYFVYNPQSNKELQKFQEDRFEVLREVKDFKGEDPAFMSYYTYMPEDAKWQRIRDLASSVTAGKTKPVDKVLAIRDWFAGKDEAGSKRFKYTDNPGVPDIPNASKLQYFMFENRQGYCAYFAGATLFMLRSLGIPSRIAVGFLTEDRSGGKNAGWYWYYADQAHAWVQVYFPGYGWLDFDTTVGNDDARESPKTDGTPPMQPPRAWLAADGIVVSVDTVKKSMVLKPHHVVFKDKTYLPVASTNLNMDLHIAVIRRDSTEVPLSDMKPGDSATAVSYADAFKNLAARDGEDAASLIKRLPDPEPIDEVYLRKTLKQQKEEKIAAAQVPKPTDWRQVAVNTVILVSALVLLFFLLPVFVYAYYRLRNRTANAHNQKAYWTYKTLGFYLNQVGVRRGNETPMQYAKDKVDPALGTEYSKFMNIYLKQKYAKQALTDTEAGYVSRFMPQFLSQAHTRLPIAMRNLMFLNPFRTLGYFIKGTEET